MCLLGTQLQRLYLVSTCLLVSESFLRKRAPDGSCSLFMTLPQKSHSITSAVLCRLTPSQVPTQMQRERHDLWLRDLYHTPKRIHRMGYIYWSGLVQKYSLLHLREDFLVGRRKLLGKLLLNRKKGNDVPVWFFKAYPFFPWRSSYYIVPIMYWTEVLRMLILLDVSRGHSASRLSLLWGK